MGKGKVALLGDLHIGVRNGDEDFLNFQTYWLKKALLRMKKEGVEAIIQAGDFFDIRKQTPNNVLYWVSETFIPLVRECGIPWYVNVGNHDIFYKFSNEIHTTAILQQQCPELIKVYPRFATVDVAGTDFFFIPWLDKENAENLDSELAKTKAKYAIGHLDIAGFAMMAGIVNEGGLPASKFKQFDMLWSGHFHTVSANQNIQYIGSPYHLNWMDFVDGDERGWFLFDPNTGKADLIKNSEYDTLFSFFVYDEGFDYNDDFMQDYKGTILQVVVKEKTNQKRFNNFKALLANSKLISYSIVDETVLTSNNEDVTIDESVLEKGTVESIKEYINELEIENVDNVKLQEKAIELYMEADKL